jgi:hypothetical protein
MSAKIDFLETEEFNELVLDVFERGPQGEDLLKDWLTSRILERDKSININSYKQGVIHAMNGIERLQIEAIEYVFKTYGIHDGKYHKMDIENVYRKMKEEQANGD